MEASATAIRMNIDQIRERIQNAARRASRPAEEVRLVVVTKGQPPEVIRAAIAAGARYLGENYPEETEPKIQEIGKPGGVEWHMIGHLQSRKSAIVADHFDMIQSLDSLRLAERLDRQLAERGRTLPVLLEFNVGGEESKSGWYAADAKRWEQFLPDVEAILKLPHLSVRGLMTMPPWYEDPEKTRPFFASLRALGDFFAGHFGSSLFTDFSMGTSIDFEAAVEEGATLVRIGTAILGPRPPKVKD